MEERMAIKITARKNGPFRVETTEGEVVLLDHEGTQYDLTGKPMFSLCRCGGSTNKPFCDGTHSKIGFQAAETAVKKADAQPGNPSPSSPAKG
jgi:CDGSH-type Zn-finger protein